MNGEVLDPRGAEDDLEGEEEDLNLRRLGGGSETVQNSR